MKSPCMTFTGLDSGVTHLLFSQKDGNILYSGFRKIGVIVGWDLRNPGKVLHTLQRVVDTNQRIYFDLASGGDFLVSGSTTGHVYGWKIEPSETELQSCDYSHSDSLEPTLYHLAHSDAVNGMSVHPNLPIIASCSGQRHYKLPDSCSDEEMETENDTSSNSDISQGSSPNSLRLWHYGR